MNKSLRLRKPVNYRKFFPVESNLFQLLVSIMLLLAFILVMITGILSFVRLNRIIGTVNSTIRHDQKLAKVKDVYNDVLEAESRMKAFTVSGREKDFARFSELTVLIPGKMIDLKNQVIETDSLKLTIDTFDILVEEKLNNLEMMLILQDNSQLFFAMDEVLEKISTGNVPADTVRTVPDTAKLTDSSEEEVINSLMSRRRDIIPEEENDTVRIAARPANDIAFTKLAEEVEKIKRQAMSEDYAVQQHEMDLIRQDRIIMQRIRNIISRWELNEERSIRMKIGKAESEASGIRQIIVSFGLAIILFLLLGAAMTFFYFRRNKEYRLILLKARNDAEELAQAKERFLAGMSHEIKTPMNVISGYLSQILKSPLEKQQRENLEIVKKSSDHLLVLLNNLLDLSKLQAQKLELSETAFSPAELIHEMEGWFSPAAIKKNIRLITEIHPGLPSRLTGDPVRMRQVLANLIDNAIKFTDAGTVTIRVYPSTISDGLETFVFEVSDTGIGIPKDDLANIFQEFSQGKVFPGKKTEGIGLGLAITAKLVEKMGGTLQVASTPGQGSVFKAEIPFKLANAIRDSQDSEILPGLDLLEDLLILVVDDEAFNRSLLKLMLDKHHCRVVEAADGEEAIAVATENNPDLVLMDIRMPGISGPEAAEKIREILLERGNDIPIIAVSAGVTLEEMNIYRRSGMRDFISKPFEEEELINAIIKLLDKGEIPAASGEITLEYTGKETKPPEPELAFDLEPLKKSCGYDPKFFGEMVALFLENTDAGLTKMEGHLKKGSMKEIADIAHKISAPCRQIRAESLYSLLKIAENQAKNAKNSELRTTMIKIRKEFERIRSGIQDQMEFKKNRP